MIKITTKRSRAEEEALREEGREEIRNERSTEIHERISRRQYVDDVRFVRADQLRIGDVIVASAGGARGTFYKHSTVVYADSFYSESCGQPHAPTKYGTLWVEEDYFERGSSGSLVKNYQRVLVDSNRPPETLEEAHSSLDTP